MRVPGIHFPAFEKRPEGVARTPRDELIENLRDWSYQTTSHGLPHFMLAKKLYQKIIWIALIIANVVLCAIMVSKTVDSYFSFNVVSKVRMVVENEIVFPVVSICNTNPFSSPVGNEFIRSYYMTTYNLTNIDGYQQLAEYFRDKRIPMETDWILYQTFSPSFDPGLKRMLGLDMGSMLFACRFNKNDCNRSDFDWYYHPLLGNCFKFNWGKDTRGLKKVFSEGSGLRVEMLAGLSDVKNSFFSPPSYQGISILIEDHLSFPIVREGILIKHGFYSSIRIQKVESSRLPYPYSNCVNRNSAETELANEMKRLGITYNHRNCLILCQQKQIIDSLGCYNTRWPPLFDSPPCLDRDAYYKISNMAINFSLCNNLCPFECQSVSFDMSISYAEFPTYNYYMNAMVEHIDFFERFFGTRNITYEMLKNNMVSFFVYFDELVSIKFEEAETLSLVDMVANVGGTLGLFVGVSVLTFGELFVLVIDFFIIYIRDFYKSKFGNKH